jgi:hypothetical protein
MKLRISLKKISAALPRVVLIQGFPTHLFPGQFFSPLKNVLPSPLVLKQRPNCKERIFRSWPWKRSRPTNSNSICRNFWCRIFVERLVSYLFVVTLIFMQAFQLCGSKQFGHPRPPKANTYTPPPFFSSLFLSKKSSLQGPNNFVPHGSGRSCPITAHHMITMGGLRVFFNHYACTSLPAGLCGPIYIHTYLHKYTYMYTWDLLSQSQNMVMCIYANRPWLSSTKVKKKVFSPAW